MRLTPKSPGMPAAPPDADCTALRISAKHIALLCGCFVITRSWALLAGMHYLSNESAWLIQVLDLDVLHHHLLRGLLHLHAQPPLFNALIGAAEKLAGPSFGGVMLCLQLLLGLCASICVYLTLVQLDVTPRFSLLASLFLLLNPSEILFEFDALYTSIVVSLNCLIALALVCYVKRRSSRALYALLALAVCLTLLRSSYHWLWIMAMVAVLFWQLPESRKQLAKAGAVAVFLALLWPAKNYLLFHHFASTTWGPYNMSRHWGEPPYGPPLQQWIDQGLLPSFSRSATQPEPEWLRQHWLMPPVGAPELDDIVKATRGATNWNSLTMLRMHDAQAKDIAFLLRHDPKLYLHNAGLGIVFYFEPSSVYFTQSELWPMWHESVAQYQKLSTVDRIVRRVCCNVFGFPADEVGPTPSRRTMLAQRIRSLCMGSVLAYALVFACLLSFRLRPSLWTGSRDRKVAALVIILTIFYLFAVVSLVEVGENMRFRFETHALVILVVAIFLQQLWDRRRAQSR
jgi:hypothetical protein